MTPLLANRRVLVGALAVMPRVIADLVIVHAAMLAVIALEALELQVKPASLSSLSVHTLRSYYLTVFCPLSLLFPCIHSIGGLYTRARFWSLRAKLVRAAASAATGALVASLVTLLWADQWSSSVPVLIAFSVLIIIGTPGIRWLKHTMFEYETSLSPGNGETRTTVLVVGGAGYIGSILVRKLLRRGYSVRVLDSLVYGDQALRKVMHHPRLQFIKGDCRTIHDVVSAMTGVQSVVHLAAIVGDPACDWDHKTAREINYSATRMMIEVAKGEGPVRFVFASSCSVYGTTRDLMDEKSEVNPISLYADTKLDSEMALLSAASHEFHPTILRFSTIFGLSPRPRFDLVVNLLTAKAHQEGLISIFNGQQWRPFLHVSDAAEAVVRALEAPVEVVSGQIYNVGDNRLNYNLRTVAKRIGEIFPRTKIEYAENADQRDYRVSFRKIREELGFRCSKNLDDGILELKQAFDRRTICDYKDPIYSNVKFLQVHGSPEATDQVNAQVMAALAEKA